VHFINSFESRQQNLLQPAIWFPYAYLTGKQQIAKNKQKRRKEEGGENMR